MNDRTDEIRSTRAPTLGEDQIEVLGRYGQTRETHIGQFYLLQGAVPQLPQPLGDDLVALVVRVKPILTDVSLVQVNFGEGDVAIAGCPGDAAIDFIHVR